jgi:uncharacterized damage-inducible protein DinB
VSAALDHVLRHNTWATGALIAFCRAVDPEQLGSATAPGTYGTLYGTLQHLVVAEQWYVSLLTGEILGRPIRRTDPPHSLDELAATAQATGARLLGIAASHDPDRVIAMEEGRRSTLGIVLAQVVHHGNEHRTQATTVLGAHGIEPPPLSSWAYGRARGVSTAEE